MWGWLNFIYLIPLFCVWNIFKIFGVWKSYFLRIKNPSFFWQEKLKSLFLKVENSEIYSLKMDTFLFFLFFLYNVDKWNPQLSLCFPKIENTMTVVTVGLSFGMGFYSNSLFKIIYSRLIGLLNAFYIFIHFNPNKPLLQFSCNWIFKRC